MATVIDSLIVTLGLDPKDFAEGKKKAVEAFTELKAKASETKEHLKKVGEGVEGVFDKGRESVDKLLEAFKKIHEIQEFSTKIAEANAAVGRLATRLGMTPEVLSSFEAAVQRYGGTAAGAASSLQDLGDKILALKAAHKDLPEAYGNLEKLSGVTIDRSGDVMKTVMSLADALKTVKDQFGDHEANYLGRMITPDASTITLLQQGSDKLKELMTEIAPDALTGPQVEAATSVEDAWAKAEGAINSFKNAALASVAPVLVQIIEDFHEWIEANKELAASWIGERAGELSEFLKSIDWAGLRQGIADFGSGVQTVVNALGGWKSAVEIIIGLWAGMQIVSMIAAVVALASAFALVGPEVAVVAAGIAALVAAGAGLYYLFNATKAWLAEHSSPKDFIDESDRKSTEGAQANLKQGADMEAARGKALMKVGERQRKADLELQQSQAREATRARALGGLQPPQAAKLDQASDAPIADREAAHALAYRNLRAAVVAGASDKKEVKLAGPAALKVGGAEISVGNPLPVIIVGQNDGGSGDGGGGRRSARSAAAIVGGYLGGSVGGAAPGSTKDAMRAAMDQLKKEGVPDANLRAAAALLVGEAMKESDLDPSKVHDKGTGYGIYGARNERRSKMFAWLKANGYAQNSLEGQMRYMAHEAMNVQTFAATRAALMGATQGNIAAETYGVTKNFENPKIVNDRRAAVLDAYRIGPSLAPVVPNVPVGAPGAALTNSGIVNHLRTATNQTNSEVHIGAVHVNTQARDAEGIARDIQPALRRSYFASQANYGLA